MKSRSQLTSFFCEFLLSIFVWNWPELTFLEFFTVIGTGFGSIVSIQCLFSIFSFVINKRKRVMVLQHSIIIMNFELREDVLFDGNNFLMVNSQLLTNNNLIEVFINQNFNRSWKNSLISAGCMCRELSFINNLCSTKWLKMLILLLNILWMVYWENYKFSQPCAYNNFLE